MAINLRFVLSVVISASALVGCVSNNSTPNSEPKRGAVNTAITNATTPTSTPVLNSNESIDKNEVATTGAPDQNNAACYDLKRDDFVIDKKQTFGIDFPPFGKSCFVVFHDPEFDNPPMNSQYFIYKDGKEAFAFPDQFNGSNVGCWIEAVSFEDLNGDSMNDIAIIGKCSARSKPYNENVVYINTGKDFKINVDANQEMLDFTKMSQIKQYVKEHQSLFSK